MALSTSQIILIQAAIKGKLAKWMKHPFEHRPRPRGEHGTIGSQVQGANHWTMTVAINNQISINKYGMMEFT